MSNHSYYDKYQRDEESKAFYNSPAWRKCRQAVLKRDYHLCQQCLRDKKITQAQMVHHIKELKDYPELALDKENLISLCHSCHNKEHPEKGQRKKKKSHRRVKVIKAQANPEMM